MKAQIKTILSSDFDPATKFPLSNCDGVVFLDVYIGTVDEDGSDLFQFNFCSYDFAGDEIVKNGIWVKDAPIIVGNIDYNTFCRKMHDFVSSFEEESWTDLAKQLDRYGRWEFRDYNKCYIFRQN